MIFLKPATAWNNLIYCEISRVLGVYYTRNCVRVSLFKKWGYNAYPKKDDLLGELKDNLITLAQMWVPLLLTVY